MNVQREWILLLAAALLVLVGCSQRSTEAAAAPSLNTPGAIAVARQPAAGDAFVPPAETAIPDDEFGAMVRRGRDIFLHTPAKAAEYVGNGLSCTNCHLDAGRRADSAPLWAAWVMYPAYRNKNRHVNTFAERLQGCFQFSMNGKAPPADSEVVVALQAYAYWMAQGAPTGVAMAGRGYPALSPPPLTPDYARGQKVFTSDCALCHGADGQGQKVAGNYVFPPLWGPDSFNWGAGMQRVNTAAGFIQANMPFSRGGTLSDQDAWDVAWYMDSHERPQDPRYTGDVAATRARFHDHPWSRYGVTVNGRLLGSEPLRP